MTPFRAVDGEYKIVMILYSPQFYIRRDFINRGVEDKGGCLRIKIKSENLSTQTTDVER